MWKTPATYREYPGGKDLPDKMKVWRVQNTNAGFEKMSDVKDFSGLGVVIAPDYFGSKTNAEVLVEGYNLTKGYGAVAVGRYKNYLWWGFSAVPSKMNDNGKNLFLNSLHYISKFAKK